MRKNNRIGETNNNYQGLQMTIVAYRSRRDIDVKFSDGYIAHNVRYANFLEGSITSNLYPQYLGIGYLGDGEYKSRIDGIKTPEYICWSSMLTRCYSDKYIKKKNYIACSVCDEWHNFQNFAKWYQNNSYALEDDVLELDKDIIQKGNKIYSPDKCILVPHKINTIICNRHNDRGRYYIGVRKAKNGYTAICNIKGKQTYFGTYPTEIEAFYAYKRAKETEIKRVAELYRGTIPDLIIEYISKHKIELTD